MATQLEDDGTIPEKVVEGDPLAVEVLELKARRGIAGLRCLVVEVLQAGARRPRETAAEQEDEQCQKAEG